MSNNKQHMKLYTEEQVRLAMDFARGHNKMTDSQFIDSLTPIELPSDEEIDKKAYDDFKETIEKYNSQSNNEQQ